MKKNIKNTMMGLIVLSLLMILTSCASISYDQRGGSRIDKDPERRGSIHSPTGYKIGP